MMRMARALGLALAGSLLFFTPPLAAQGFQEDEGPKVQITPFVGYAFGGSIRTELLDQQFNFKSGLNYGGSVDFSLSDSWRVELLYTRQETTLESAGVVGPSFDITVERYLIGLQEEKGEGSVKPFGTLLLGATRFVPGFDAGSETYFTGGLALGVKTFLSDNVGLRFEARGFYTVVSGAGGVFCTAGQCLFRFSGNGLWQGDVSAGLIIAF